MKNIQRFKYKVGQYVVWDGLLFRVVEHKHDQYMLQNVEEKRWTPFFERHYESMFKHVTKKKNPEYWL